MRWAVQPGDTPLFGSERGCDEFEQRVLRFDGASEAFASDADDEVLYVLAGSGTLEIGGESIDVREGAAVWAARGTTWRVAEADALRAPLGARSRARRAERHGICRRRCRGFR